MGFGMIRGALAGAGGAMEQSGMEMLKSQLEEQRQSTLAALQAQYAQATHAANAQTDIANIPAKSAAETAGLVERGEALRPGLLATERAKADIAVEEAKAKPRTIAAGATEKIGDQTYTAPEKQLTPEQQDYYKAVANRMNAEADAIRNGMKYQPRAGEKPVLPNIKPEKDADGNPVLIDQNSGAWATIEPGQPAKKGETHWFGPNEPDSPAQGPKPVWHHPQTGEVLPNGLVQFYPSLSGRVGPAGSATSGSGVDWSKFGATAPSTPTQASTVGALLESSDDTQQPDIVGPATAGDITSRRRYWAKENARIRELGEQGKKGGVF